MCCTSFCTLDKVHTKCFKTVKIHKGKSHKEAFSPEKFRKSCSQPPLTVSPMRDQSRVESCHNCDMEMSPTHLCQDDEDSPEEEDQAMSTLEFQTKMVMLMRDLQSVKVSVWNLIVTYRPSMAGPVNFKHSCILCKTLEVFWHVTLKTTTTGISFGTQSIDFW